MIASRSSRLARIQAELVGNALQRLHRHVPVQYRWIESEGEVGGGGTGKGIFTRAIEKVLLAEEADIGVHSLKDLPATDTPGLQIGAVPKRADERDCLISAHGVGSIDALPAGTIVGTSSPRRAAQLLARCDKVRIKPIRGNVDTRVGKVLKPAGQRHYDATILAVAGLGRLGLSEHAGPPLDPDQMLPAAGQGAIAIQCRRDDHLTLTRCLPINHPTAAIAVHAERQVVAGLGADCHCAIGVLASPHREADRDLASRVYRLRVRVMSRDGQHCLEIDESATVRQLRRLVLRVIADLQARGAESLLAQGSVDTTAFVAS